MTTKLRVLRVITRLNIGGPTIHTVLLTAHLNDDRFESTLVAGRIEDNEADMSYFADKHGVSPLYIEKMSREIRIKDDFKSFRQLYRITRQTKPHIVHTHTAKAGMLGRSAAVLAGVPIIIHTFHGNVFKGYFGRLKTWMFIVIERLLSRYCSAIIAISEQQRKELLHYDIADENQLRVINLGFQFESIRPEDKDLNSFRDEFKVPHGAKLIGIIGRLVPIKNHSLFLEIAEELLSERDDLYFAIIGDGELRADLEREIDSKKLRERVFITGFIKNLKPVYADLDLVLLTSDNEGTPVALIEAMACRKVVISTKVGGVEDFVENNVNGFYTPAKEKKEFVKIIRDWLKNPDDFRDIGLKAEQSVVDRFSSENLVARIKSLYLEFAEESKLLKK